MKIDLKWGLPFAMPFVTVAMIKAIFWFAGAAIDPEVVAVVGLVLGMFGGVGAVLILADLGDIWPVKIGKARNND
jgi:hypothetical protein